MKVKIFRSFYITTGCILFITLTLLFVIMSVAINGYTTQSRHSVLDKSVLTVVDLIDNNYSEEEIYSSIRTLSKVNEMNLFICNSKGQVGFCSCDAFMQKSECEHSQISVSQEYLSEISDEISFGLTTMQGRFEDMRYVSSKRMYLDSEDVSIYLFANATTVSVTQMFSTLFKMYAFTAIVPLVFMFVAEYIITYRLAKPLKYMSAVAKSIAKGDYSKRVPVMSDDEIGELSVLFNRMSDSISKNEMVRRSFISNISHELKTPMTTIGGFIDGMLDGTIDEGRRDYYLKIVSEEVKRLSRLVTSMLSIARLESDERVISPTEFDFAELVLSVVVSMEQRITEKRLSVKGLDELSHTVINADKDLIYQVVYNLVDNAIKYSGEYGYFKIRSHRIGDKLEFSIRNDGIGIPKDDLPYVFERFYKTDKSRSGHKDSLGLGLFITKKIVTLHDGEISVRSEMNDFTEFTVKLPINRITENRR